MFDGKKRVIIEDYTNKPTFASFLPGISGMMGTPIWCFYMNRGQGISSFGVRDKDHCIMEFHAAQQAYQNVSTLGFRTFMKVDGSYYEAFGDEEVGSKDVVRTMFIGANEVEVEEAHLLKGIQVNALHFTLPNEEIGGLVRQVTIKNIDNKSHVVDVLDGMAQVVPYGINLWSMKMMGQTCKAWMEVEGVEDYKPVYGVRASMEDSAVVTQVEGKHFYRTLTKEGTLLPCIVDTEVVFGQSTSLIRPHGFINYTKEELLEQKQMTQNALPCGFFSSQVSLEPGESYCIYSVIGCVENEKQLERFESKLRGKDYFQAKYEEAKELTQAITKVINTKTASPVFDAYCEQTYLDNVLRGGMPLLLGDKNIYHVYSRKHGDTERDYNFFSMNPEFYSQGNGNFRDVNQNRRCDVYFADFVKDFNIKTFYNLIQLDGYNPLAVQGVVYTLDEVWHGKVLELVDNDERVRALLEKSFTPGAILKVIVDKGIGLTTTKEEFIHQLIKEAVPHMQAAFGEGYWTDHWTYNLDLVESYLGIYPEKEKELLFEDGTYTYFESGAVVNPRKVRYMLTDKGVRQYNGVDHHIKEGVTHKEAREKGGKGKVYTSTLFEKMMILAINKFATLDPYGMGIEMEGGKPGWYDALNGLPGIFGSSMAETYELGRMLEFMQQAIANYKGSITLPVEVLTFMKGVQEALVRYEAGKIDDLTYWEQVNEAKETYREAIMWGIEGEKRSLTVEEVRVVLHAWQEKIQKGIEKGMTYGEGVCPTYFTYEVEDYEEREGSILPLAFKVIPMPYFLEGPVRYLKTQAGRKESKNLYNKVKASGLYDDQLNMYKVNASLKDTSYEIGRAKAFTPGWLENESIWLHMEYKYLIELLRSGLYEEYFEAMHHALVPFLDPKVYGRSVLENSSFIASSANPNEKIHGRGFVARLSGSTAEFLHMWQIMMFGERPFTVEGDELVLAFKPTIPSYLIGEDKRIEAMFLGDVQVIYHLDTQEDLLPDKVKVENIVLTYSNGVEIEVKEQSLKGDLARAVRDHKVRSIDVNMTRK